MSLRFRPYEPFRPRRTFDVEAQDFYTSRGRLKIAANVIVNGLRLTGHTAKRKFAEIMESGVPEHVANAGLSAISEIHNDAKKARVMESVIDSARAVEGPSRAPVVVNVGRPSSRDVHTQSIRRPRRRGRSRYRGRYRRRPRYRRRSRYRRRPGYNYGP